MNYTKTLELNSFIKKSHGKYIRKKETVYKSGGYWKYKSGSINLFERIYLSDLIDEMLLRGHLNKTASPSLDTMLLGSGFTKINSCRWEKGDITIRKYNGYLFETPTEKHHLSFKPFLALLKKKKIIND